MLRLMDYSSNNRFVRLFYSKAEKIKKITGVVFLISFSSAVLALPFILPPEDFQLKGFVIYLWIYDIMYLIIPSALLWLVIKSMQRKVY